MHFERSACSGLIDSSRRRTKNNAEDDRYRNIIFSLFCVRAVVLIGATATVRVLIPFQTALSETSMQTTTWDSIVTDYLPTIRTYVNLMVCGKRADTTIQKIMTRLSTLLQEGRLTVEPHTLDGTMQEVCRVMVRDGLTLGDVLCIKGELRLGHARGSISIKYDITEEFLDAIASERVFAEIGWPDVKRIPETEYSDTDNRVASSLYLQMCQLQKDGSTFEQITDLINEQGHKFAGSDWTEALVSKLLTPEPGIAGAL